MSRAGGRLLPSSAPGRVKVKLKSGASSVGEYGAVVKVLVVVQHDRFFQPVDGDALLRQGISQKWPEGIIRSTRESRV